MLIYTVPHNYGANRLTGSQAPYARAVLVDSFVDTTDQAVAGYFRFSCCYRISLSLGFIYALPAYHTLLEIGKQTVSAEVVVSGGIYNTIARKERPQSPR